MDSLTYALQIMFAPAAKDKVIGALIDREITSFQEGDSTPPGESGLTIANEDRKIICYFPSLSAAEELKRGLLDEFPDSADALAAEIAPIPTEQWQDAWKAFAQPVEISSRLLIVPSSKRAGPRPGQARIEIDPQAAFGSGSHETTQLCLKAIDQRLQEKTVKSLLDVGCGSGILSIAAAILGVPEVLGIDLDDDIITAAKENARRNAAECNFTSTPLAEITGSYDLVVANILSSSLTLLWNDLTPRIVPGGLLIVSGILAAEESEFTGRIGAAPVQRTSAGEWIALLFEKPE